VVDQTRDKYMVGYMVLGTPAAQGSSYGWLRSAPGATHLHFRTKGECKPKKRSAPDGWYPSDAPVEVAPETLRLGSRPVFEYTSLPPFAFRERRQRMHVHAFCSTLGVLLMAFGATSALQLLRVLGPECG